MNVHVVEVLAKYGGLPTCILIALGLCFRTIRGDNATQKPEERERTTKRMIYGLTVVAVLTILGWSAPQIWPSGQPSCGSNVQQQTGNSTSGTDSPIVQCNSGKMEFNGQAAVQQSGDKGKK